MKIIAFSGKKQSGKTTAVDDLRLRMHGCVGADFADALKQLVITYFINPVSTRQDRLFNSVLKFSEDNYKQTVHPCGKTYRELLQIIGTDWFRAIWPDVWVEGYKTIIADWEEGGEERLITTDVRFPNEVRCVQSLGGHVIRLLRAPFPDDKHESETALDFAEMATLFPKSHYYKNTTPILFDAVLDNCKMTIAEQNEAVWDLIKERNWL